MKTRMKQSRWAAIAALAIALSAGAATADEPSTVTVNGTVYVGVSSDFPNGGDHAWSLTMYGTTYRHSTYQSGTTRVTSVYAESFDLVFSGPDGDALNEIVSAHLTGGDIQLVMSNHYATYPSSDFAVVDLRIESPEQGLSFWAGHEEVGSWILFPYDADGYPVLGPEPFSQWVESIYITDDRPGGPGVIAHSYYNTVEFAGDIGSSQPATLSIGDEAVLEGDRGGKNKLWLPVVLSNTTDHAVSVSYRTVNGTAIAKSDYNAASGTITFQPGDSVKTIAISIKGDRTVEPDETFTVELFNAVGATIVDGVATATIRNDD